MLNIEAIYRKNSAQAASYYADMKDDYYSKEGASSWQGSGAQTLGLSGEVDSAVFYNVLQGELPGRASLPRSVRHDSKARAGLDFTFSAPKSVSIQALVGKDHNLVKAHDRAVTRVLEEVEKLARSRMKINGKSHEIDTGNLVIAKFRHETARPTEGAPPDPNLHTHAVVMNMTQREDGEWRSVVNDMFFQMKRYLDAVYISELATNAKELGYGVRFDKNGNFELDHLSRDQLEVFSKRSQQLVAALETKGLTRETASAQQKEAIILALRKNKPVELTRQDLQAAWERQARELNINLQRQHQKGPGLTTPADQRTPAFTPTKETGERAIAPSVYAADVAVRWATKHLTERESVMHHSDLKIHAMSHAAGLARSTDIDRAIDTHLERGRLIAAAPTFRSASEKEDGLALSREEWIVQLSESGKRTPEQAAQLVDQGIAAGRLVATEARYTTSIALSREKSILRMEEEGRGQAKPIMEASAIRTRLEAATLNAGQMSAAEMMLGTSNRIVAVQGYAGTGKSHMLKAVSEVLTEQGLTVRTIASYGTQVRALRELGVESNTIASMLSATSRGRFALDEKTVLIVDEAGVVPTRLMDKILAAAERSNARVVLVGDIAQTKAIEAGRPFDQLQKAGMETAVMDEIQRQRNAELKHAVEVAATKLSQSGLAHASLQGVTAIQEIKDKDIRHQAIASRYVGLADAERDNTLIVTGSNESRREINDLVRDALGTTGQGHNYALLSRRDTTQAERRLAQSYFDNDIIQPERNYKCGLQRGELYTILGRGNGNTLIVQDQQGQQITFNPARVSKLSVYEPIVAEVAAGDWIRITRNDAERDLANGNRFQVLSSTPESLTIDAHGRHVTLPADAPLHLDLAYATTVHSAQGLTSERVIINANSKSPTTKEDVYYVAISRARQAAEIFTDNESRLPEAISRESIKTAALDLALPSAADSDAIKKPQREMEMSG